LLEEAQCFIIKDQSKIYTACGDGKIPFVSMMDIAVITFHMLTDKKPHNTDYKILGPELLTYNKVWLLFLSFKINRISTLMVAL
jgi:festuclavine dehydrogenase